MDGMFRTRGRRLGFTLLELLLVVAILALTATQVLPGLDRWRDNLHLRTAADQWLSGLNRARSEAVARGVAVSLCPASSGQAGCGNDYSQGWILFTDKPRDGRFEADVDELLDKAPSLPEGFTVTNRSGERIAAEVIRYLPDGSARRSLTHLFCAPSGRSVPPVAVVLNHVGRARLAQGEGQCPV